MLLKGEPFQLKHLGHTSSNLEQSHIDKEFLRCTKGDPVLQFFPQISHNVCNIRILEIEPLE